MANLRYLNQQDPFWDFLSSLENSGNHPFSNAYNPETHSHNGAAAGGGSGGADAPNARHEASEAQGTEHHDPSPQDNPFSSGFPFGGPLPHRGPHHGRGSWGHRGGRCGASNSNNPFGAFPMDIPKLASFLSQFIPTHDPSSSSRDPTSTSTSTTNDFTPPADIFDTPTAYVIHLSLPGARKEDVGVNWDADRSELNVAGVVYRPGDEEFLKTLALDERKVGVFERKVRLGSVERPALVDGEGIGARMEDGVLMVTVPKVDGGFVEVRKVDIE